MKKIDKSSCLAKEYFLWQKSNKDKYYSSHKYYKDVLCSLVLCQNGLCAYTEYRLVEEDELNNIKKNFNSNGVFNGVRPEAPIDNEHFYSSLKVKNGWSWDNFFGVYSSVNIRVKRVREAELIKAGKKLDKRVKPDSKDFDAKKLFLYNKEEHMFYPNPDLAPDLFNAVKDAIYVLGLNWGYIRSKRKEYINKILKEKKYLGDVTINQFYTALELLGIEN